MCTPLQRNARVWRVTNSEKTHCFRFSDRPADTLIRTLVSGGSLAPTPSASPPSPRGPTRLLNLPPCAFDLLSHPDDANRMRTAVPSWRYKRYWEYVGFRRNFCKAQTSDCLHTYTVLEQWPMASHGDLVQPNFSDLASWQWTWKNKVSLYFEIVSVWCGIEN